MATREREKISRVNESEESEEEQPIIGMYEKFRFRYLSSKWKTRSSCENAGIPVVPPIGGDEVSKLEILLTKFEVATRSARNKTPLLGDAYTRRTNSRKGKDLTEAGVLYPRASIKTKYRSAARRKDVTEEIARVGFWNRARTKTEIGLKVELQSS